MDGVTQHDLRHCPTCGATITAAGTFTRETIPPSPGDWTLCAKCLYWHVYLEDHYLRPITDEEWQALSDEDRAELNTQRDRVRRAWMTH